jgi:hypothetical protein
MQFDRLAELEDSRQPQQLHFHIFCLPFLANRSSTITWWNNVQTDVSKKVYVELGHLGHATAAMPPNFAKPSDCTETSPGCGAS